MEYIGKSQATFPFDQATSPLFKKVFRPIALVSFWSRKTRSWIPVWGIVDTGADYTILPKGYAEKLGIDIEKDCKTYTTSGVGGEEKSHIIQGWKMKIGFWERVAPVGFLNRNDMSPLFGRQEFLETFILTFKNHKTIFQG